MYTLVISKGEAGRIRELLAWAGSRIRYVVTINATCPAPDRASIEMDDDGITVAGDVLFAGSWNPAAFSKVAGTGLRCVLTDLTRDVGAESVKGFSFGTTFDVFRVAVGVYMPRHIQANVAGWDLIKPKDLQFLAECKWKKELALMQSSCSALGGVDEIPQWPTYGAKDVRRKNVGANSYLSLRLGDAPKINPYGTKLAVGRGVLPYRGPNHMIVVAFVDRERVWFSYTGDFSASPPTNNPLNLDQRYNETMPTPLPEHDYVEVYRGYFPHHTNTRDAWIEATVVAVPAVAPLAGPSSTSPPPTAIETVWLKSIFFERDQALTAHVERATYDETLACFGALKNTFPQEALNLFEMLHIADWTRLAAWFRMYPDTDDVMQCLVQGTEIKRATVKWLEGIFAERTEADAFAELESEVHQLTTTVFHPVNVHMLSLCMSLDLWVGKMFEDTFKEGGLALMRETYLSKRAPVVVVLESVSNAEVVGAWNSDPFKKEKLLIFGTEANFNCAQKMTWGEHRARALLADHVSQIHEQVKYVLGDNLSALGMRWRGEHMRETSPKFSTVLRDHASV